MVITDLLTKQMSTLHIPNQVASLLWTSNKTDCELHGSYVEVLIIPGTRSRYSGGSVTQGIRECTSPSLTYSIFKVRFKTYLNTKRD